MTKTDIHSPSDVTKLIKTFYDKLLTSSINHHFVNLNLEEHLPRIDSFWNATLFPDHTYAQNLVEKHMHLPLKKEEFAVWLSFFHATVDELFAGTNADITKNRASSIAYIMQKKLLKD
ncbi:MAG: group III truncated hemoglobin [Bacteroidetes bacterium]|nr:group III truncated hemoglobin [Bacteroidota bacterium]